MFRSLTDHHQGAYDWSLAKVTVSLKSSFKYIIKIVGVQWQYEYQFVHSVCVECSAACDVSHAALHSTHTLCTT